MKYLKTYIFLLIILNLQIAKSIRFTKSPKAKANNIFNSILSFFLFILFHFRSASTNSCSSIIDVVTINQKLILQKYEIIEEKIRNQKMNQQNLNHFLQIFRSFKFEKTNTKKPNRIKILPSFLQKTAMKGKEGCLLTLRNFSYKFKNYYNSLLNSINITTTSIALII